MSSSTVMYVNLDDIYIDDELNNRELQDTPEELEGLAASIEGTGGLLQPIVIYPAPPDRQALHGKMYELGAGYRRSKALRYLAENNEDESWVKNVAVNLRDAADYSQRTLDQLIENIARKNLNPMETALAYKRVLDDPAIGMKMSDLAKKTGVPLPTISNAVKVTRLDPAVQSLVMYGELGWASAKELASVVVSNDLDKDTQVALAQIGVGMSHADFKDHLDETYRPAEAAKEGEEAKDVSTGNTDAAAAPAEAGQKTAQSIRTQELKEKYIPHLIELLNSEQDPAMKATQQIRLDTLKFVLKNEGTTLGAELQDWESELKEKEERDKAEKDEVRAENVYIRKLVAAVNKKLKEVPPLYIESKDPATGTVTKIENPNRDMATIAEAIQMVSDTVTADLAKAKAEGKFETVTNADGTTSEKKMIAAGFAVTSVDDITKKVHDKYNLHVVEEANRKQRREKEKLEKEAKEAADKKAADEAAAAGAEVPVETEAAVA